MGGGAKPSATEDSRPELSQTPGGAGGPPGLENGQTYAVRPAPRNHLQAVARRSRKVTECSLKITDRASWNVSPRKGEKEVPGPLPKRGMLLRSTGTDPALPERPCPQKRSGRRRSYRACSCGGASHCAMRRGHRGCACGFRGSGVVAQQASTERASGRATYRTQLNDKRSHRYLCHTSGGGSCRRRPSGPATQRVPDRPVAEPL